MTNQKEYSQVVLDEIVKRLKSDDSMFDVRNVAESKARYAVIVQMQCLYAYMVGDISITYAINDDILEIERNTIRSDKSRSQFIEVPLSHPEFFDKIQEGTKEIFDRVQRAVNLSMNSTKRKRRSKDAKRKIRDIRKSGK